MKLLLVSILNHLTVQAQTTRTPTPATRADLHVEVLKCKRRNRLEMLSGHPLAPSDRPCVSRLG